MPQKIIIDTDPGIDDTMAITFALRSPELEVIGLTTVFGNADIETTSMNGLRLVELEGNDHIPVAKGCGKALIKPTLEFGTEIHGLEGMGNTNPPLPKGKLAPIHAANFIIEQVMNNPGEVTLVPIGPLTNIGLAVRLEPRIIPLVKEVVLMGGAHSIEGNISPVAEANIYNDPHAAAIVFGAGWPVTMVGLDVTKKVIQTPEHLASLYQAKNPATELIQQILPCYHAFFKKFYDMDNTIFTHDPSAIAYLINRDLFETKKVPTYVETQGVCMGQTIPDFNHQLNGLQEVNLCMDVNVQGVLSLMKERLTK
ncbi:MAG: nucleoside hydrolase [Anaerolineaceae bacterium]|nr:nucleoside hydrolase [Anaerolineaceae bacterium]